MLTDLLTMEELVHTLSQTQSRHRLSRSITVLALCTLIAAPASPQFPQCCATSLQPTITGVTVVEGIAPNFFLITPTINLPNTNVTIEATILSNSVGFNAPASCLTVPKFSNAFFLNPALSVSGLTAQPQVGSYPRERVWKPTGTITPSIALPMNVDILRPLGATCT